MAKRKPFGRPIDIAHDVNGQEIYKGDTVATIGDQTSARVKALAVDMDMEFVQIKALHQPYGKGIWHPADQVVRVSGSKKNAEAAKAAMADREE